MLVNVLLKKMCIFFDYKTLCNQLYSTLLIIKHFQHFSTFFLSFFFPTNRAISINQFTGWCQLLAVISVKRWNTFKTATTHHSLRGGGFTYGKKLTSPCIHFEPLWDCGDNRSKYSGDHLISYFCLNYR